LIHGSQVDNAITIEIAAGDGNRAGFGCEIRHTKDVRLGLCGISRE
jgi:hypothetical protein